MNKVDDTTAMMAGIDWEPTDPYAIEFVKRQVWCVAPHGKILGWIRWDEPKSRGLVFTRPAGSPH